MPGFHHEAQVRLFHNNPSLAPELLRSLSGVHIPDFARAEVGCSDLTNLKPTSYKSDDVTVLYGPGGERTMSIIVEVQLSEAEEKRYTWPLYLAEVRARLRCPVHLLVLCPDEKTAGWARTAICLGPPEMVLIPVVLGPDNTPVVTDEAQARRLPELSVLSAAAHGEEPGVLEAAMAGLDTVPERERLIYNDHIEARLNAAARKHWEELMATGTYEWQSETARKYVGQGRAEGRAEGEAQALLVMLAARGIELDPEQRKRITTCTDLDQLQTWIHNAATASGVDEVFA